MNYRPRMENEYSNGALTFVYSWKKFVDGLFSQLVPAQFLPENFFSGSHVAATLSIFVF